MIDVITFDLWNTIIDNKSYKNVRVKILQDSLTQKGLNINLNDIERTYEETFHRFSYNSELNEHRHIYNRNRLENFFKSYNLDIFSLETKKLINTFESYMLNDPPTLKEDAYEVLHELSKTYKIGLISDTGVTPGRIIKKMFQNYGVLKFFSATIFSDEVGYYKPNPIIFNIALKTIGGAAENAVHIGDLLETDIKGANDAGMHTVWIKNNYNAKKNEIKPDYIINNLSELLSCIDQINKI
ncbi:MAG: HAD family hydrolase [Promethearchaeati archaeon]